MQNHFCILSLARKNNYQTVRNQLATLKKSIHFAQGVVKDQVKRTTFELQMLTPWMQGIEHGY